MREARSSYNINFVANAKEDGLSGVDLTHFRHKLRIEQRERKRERKEERERGKEEKVGREGWCDLGNEREMMADIRN